MEDAGGSFFTYNNAWFLIASVVGIPANPIALRFTTKEIGLHYRFQNASTPLQVEAFALGGHIWTL